MAKDRRIVSPPRRVYPGIDLPSDHVSGDYQREGDSLSGAARGRVGSAVTLGNTVVLEAQDPYGASQYLQIIRARGDDIRPVITTCVIEVVRRESIGDIRSTFAHVECLVGFGSGARQEVRISPRHGVVFSVPATEIDVSARLRPIYDVGPAPPPPQLPLPVRVTATLCYGSRTPALGREGLVWQSDQLLIAEGASRQVPVQPYASEITVLGPSAIYAPGATVVSAIASNPYTVLADYTVAQYPGLANMPLPADCDTINIACAVIDGSRYRVLQGLSL